MSDIAIGTVIGGCKILEEVGQGGMATVYRARQLSMKRDVAIKILPPQFLRQTNSLERFQQEANIVARLEHRAIVPVHDYGEHDGVPYIVMRYMDGGSVDDLLADGPVSPAHTLTIIQQIAPALDYAHQHDVLHRDLKPSNILLDSNGDAYITDFGIARLLGDNTTPLTTTGVVGTPSYMSPEQAQGHDLDGRSDIYALGVVLFEMMVGARPFDGETPYSVAVKHVTATPPSACSLNSQLSRAVEQVLFKVLEKNREQRYQSAHDLAEALKISVERPPDMGHSPESMIETEPSLERAIREGEARRRVDTGRVMLSHPAPRSSAQPVPDRAASPNIQVMPPYVSSGSQSYPLLPQKSRPRRRTLIRGGWLTWIVVILVIGSFVLALTLAGVYYLINDATATPDYDPGYASTAIFKMTSTKQGILAEIGTLTFTSTPAAEDAALDDTVRPTIPPTNTLSPPHVTPTPRTPSPTPRLLPLIVTDDPATE